MHDLEKKCCPRKIKTVKNANIKDRNCDKSIKALFKGEIDYRESDDEGYGEGRWKKERKTRVKERRLPPPSTGAAALTEEAHPSRKFNPTCQPQLLDGAFHPLLWITIYFFSKPFHSVFLPNYPRILTVK